MCMCVCIGGYTRVRVYGCVHVGASLEEPREHQGWERGSNGVWGWLVPWLHLPWVDPEQGLCGPEPGPSQWQRGASWTVTCPHGMM